MVTVTSNVSCDAAIKLLMPKNIKNTVSTEEINKLKNAAGQ